jgi:hypothetical protein
MRPDTDASEKVALREAVQVSRSDIFNTSLINFSRCDVAGGDQVAQPLRGKRIDLVVVGIHAGFLIRAPLCQSFFSFRRRQ